jgi:hypothetical protein
MLVIRLFLPILQYLWSFSRLRQSLPGHWHCYWSEPGTTPPSLPIWPHGVVYLLPGAGCWDTRGQLLATQVGRNRFFPSPSIGQSQSARMEEGLSSRGAEGQTDVGSRILGMAHACTFSACDNRIGMRPHHVETIFAVDYLVKPVDFEHLRRAPELLKPYWFDAITLPKRSSP